MSDRIQHKGLKAKVMSAEAAAAMIPNGAVIGAVDSPAPATRRLSRSRSRSAPWMSASRASRSR
jgi:hypothetical protein